MIKEFKEHNIYVLGTPMYNWSIPSGLKSYIDQLMRINETWKFRSGEPDGDYVGILENKKMFILSSRGDTGYGENEKNEHMNFQTTYLKFPPAGASVTLLHPHGSRACLETITLNKSAGQICSFHTDKGFTRFHSRFPIGNPGQAWKP